MQINLKCGKCGAIYDHEAGQISHDENMSLVFENKSKCPKCGAVDEDLLTELGQSQMTEWHMKNMR
jgi:ribosomal protein S27AE